MLRHADTIDAAMIFAEGYLMLPPLRHCAAEPCLRFDMLIAFRLRLAAAHASITPHTPPLFRLLLRQPRCCFSCCCLAADTLRQPFFTIFHYVFAFSPLYCSRYFSAAFCCLPSMQSSYYDYAGFFTLLAYVLHHASHTPRHCHFHIAFVTIDAATVTSSILFSCCRGM